jgi:hypothetical protein
MSIEFSGQNKLKNMSRVLTFSRTFPSYHPKKGQPTYFVEKLNKSLPVLGYGVIFFDLIHNDIPFFDIEYYKTCEPKGHTIREGHRWKVGDKFSPRVWGTDINPKSGRSGAYQSKQIIIAPDIEVKKVWDYEVKCDPKIERWYLNNTMVSESNGITAQWFNIGLIQEIAKNDGLELVDFLNWFKHPKPFDGQIICWDSSINY